MADKPDLGVALHFLAKLKKNNNKQWFEANRSLYEDAMAQFQMLVGRLITGLGKVEDLDGLTPKDCIMRIYRDVRFSKDKSPYKTGLGAGIVPGGRKSGRIGYYLHLQPGGSNMIGGGLWEPTPEQLSRFREAIAGDAGEFRRILTSSPFKKHFGQLMGEALKKPPKGYAPDHPDLDLLRQKQICAAETFKDEIVVSLKFPDLAVESFKSMKPFIDYLNEVVG